MPFISEKLRKKISHKIDNGFAVKKVVLFCTFELLLIYIALIILGLIGSSSGIRLFNHTFKVDGNNAFWHIFGFGQNYFTSGIDFDHGYGLFLFIYAIVLLVMTITSIVFVCQIQSPKQVASETVLLETAPIQGKKHGGSNAQRVADAKLKKHE